MAAPFGNQPDGAVTKHLEFIQAVIGRLATDSFLMKGWALTVAAAIFGFAATDLNWQVAVLGLLPAVAFWFLDAYFLRQERLFRCLYDAARKGKVEAFSMDVRPYWSNVKWRKVIFSKTLWPFYGLIILVGVTLTIAAAIHDPSPATPTDMPSVDTDS